MRMAQAVPLKLSAKGDLRGTGVSHAYCMQAEQNQAKHRGSFHPAFHFRVDETTRPLSPDKPSRRDNWAFRMYFQRAKRTQD